MHSTFKEAGLAMAVASLAAFSAQACEKDAAQHTAALNKAMQSYTSSQKNLALKAVMPHAPKTAHSESAPTKADKGS